MSAWPLATFRALRHPNYRLYFASQVISLTGSWMQTAGLMLLAYQWSGSSTWVALVGAAQVGPMALLSVWGGWLADRWPRRWLIALSQSAQLIQTLLLIALVVFGPCDVWGLFTVSLLLGLCNAIDTPARMAFQVELVGREDLANAVALNSLAFNLARAVGPALGARILLWIGPVGCFAVNALSFLPVLIALSVMRLPPTPPLIRRTPVGSLVYLLDRPQMILLLALAGGMAFFGWPLLSLLPALADRRLASGEEGAALLLSSIGVGALLGALVVATFNSAPSRKITLVSGVILAALALGLLSSATHLTDAMLLCGTAGMGLILFFATGQATLQLGADDANRGRLLGVWLSVLSAAHPLGHLSAGRLADVWGVEVVLSLQSRGIVVMAVLLAAVALSLVRGKRMTTTAPTIPTTISNAESQIFSPPK